MLDLILDRVAETVEGIAPPTEADRPWKLYTGEMDEAPKVSARERRFSLEVEPELQVVNRGPIGPFIHFVKKVAVVTAYPIGSNVLAWEKQLHRDTDTLVFYLMQLANVTLGNAHLDAFLPTGDMDVEVDDDSADYAVVRLFFDCHYKLTFGS